ncbi:uncharacterized protein LOC129589257 [Paramacrobiotus metropolitanus]|uniref:uncharacterized protein LOC129589257 n=1 Tax=Paramacrobiotus metropolitanus TaxID=2943436 RepID=UPI00244575AD|nr:uncharacterized protein LOC129589257 [Paramacrobiotus metropolitanus]
MILRRMFRTLFVSEQLRASQTTFPFLNKPLNRLFGGFEIGKAFPAPGLLARNRVHNLIEITHGPFASAASSTRAFHAVSRQPAVATSRELLQQPSGLIVPARSRSTKGKVRVEYKYTPLRCLRLGSYEARMATPSGRRILMNRILKGYKYLAMSPPR